MKRPAARVRRARLADVARILAMEAHFPSDRMSPRSVRRFVGAPSAAVLVAEAKHGVVGNLVLLMRKGSRAARIYSIVVDPAARGLGIARALVAQAEAVAQQAGREAVTLEVRVDNAAARGLYASLGYAKAQPLPSFYDDGGDGVRLAKPLRGSRTAR